MCISENPKLVQSNVYLPVPLRSCSWDPLDHHTSKVFKHHIWQTSCLQVCNKWPWRSFQCLLKPVLMAGSIKCFNGVVHIRFCVKLTPIAALLKTIHSYNRHASTVKCIACTTFVFSFMSFSVSIKCIALCTRCFLFTWSQHFMIPKSRGYNMLVQFCIY